MRIILLLLSLLIIGFLYQQNIKQVQTLNPPMDCKNNNQDTDCTSASNPVNAQMQLLCQQTGQIYDPKRNGCVPTPTSTTKPTIP